MDIIKIKDSIIIFITGPKDYPAWNTPQVKTHLNVFGKVSA